MSGSQGWKAGIVVATLAGAVLAGFLYWRHLQEQAASVTRSATDTVTEPSASDPSVSATPAPVPGSTSLSMQGTVAQDTAAAPEKTVSPEATVEPEPVADVDAEEDESAVSEKPSATVMNAVREIRKPAPGEREVTTNPDGSQTMNLGNRYMSVPVATVGKDGKLHVDYHGERYAQDAAGNHNNTAQEKPSAKK